MTSSWLKFRYWHSGLIYDQVEWRHVSFCSRIYRKLPVIGIDPLPGYLTRQRWSNWALVICSDSPKMIHNEKVKISLRSHMMAKVRPTYQRMTNSSTGSSLGFWSQKPRSKTKFKVQRNIPPQRDNAKIAYRGVGNFRPKVDFIQTSIEIHKS